MVPSAFVVLDRFPLTPNGKIDRRALPAPTEESASEVPPVEPTTLGGDDDRSGIEKDVRSIWATVLDRSSLSLDDNFFDLGGHSLLAVRVHRELKQRFGGQLLITDLFRFPTIRSLARHIALTTSASAPSGDEESGRECPPRGAERIESSGRSASPAA